MKTKTGYDYTNSYWNDKGEYKEKSKQLRTLYDYTNSYWNDKGEYKEKSKQLRTLVPEIGESQNPKIELYRVFQNVYYDLYNNGLCNKENYKEEIKNVIEFYFNDLKLSSDLKNKKYLTSVKNLKEDYEAFENVADVIINFVYNDKEIQKMLVSKNEIPLTVKYLQENFDSVYKAEEYIRTLQKEYPKLAKPLLKNNHNATSDEILEYGKKLKEYEIQKIEYDKEKAGVKNHNDNIWNIFDMYIREKSGLNDIPEDKRSKVYSLAWDRGHSSGYAEVYNELVSLVDLFN